MWGTRILPIPQKKRQHHVLASTHSNGEVLNSPSKNAIKTEEGKKEASGCFVFGAACCGSCTSFLKKMWPLVGLARWTHDLDTSAHVRRWFVFHGLPDYAR
jgi:hypothetical protein